MEAHSPVVDTRESERQDERAGKTLLAVAGNHFLIIFSTTAPCNSVTQVLGLHTETKKSFFKAIRSSKPAYAGQVIGKHL